MRKFYSSYVALGLSVTAVVFLNSSSSFAQGQGGALWQPSGQNAAYTMRSIGIKTSSPLYDADVNGSLHSRTAVVDSILSCWEVMVSDILTVGNKLIVGGKISAAGISVTGLAESGSIITGNIISTNVNADSLSANYISATGLSTVSINSQNYYYNGNLINIPQIQTDIQNGKTRITALETTAAVHDSLLSNITSSQWQNNDTNIYFNSGFVGVGTSEPSETLEINGRVKITGTAPSDSVTPPTPAPNKSIIIDGGIDRITATSGTLDFANTNLTTTGNIQSTSITTTNITITDNIKTKSAEFDTLKVIERMQVESSLTSDTLHALKSLEVNNSLRLVRDTAEMYAEVSTNDTAVALMLQKDPSASVEIGEAAPTPAGEARAKLTVEGNTRLNGELKVSGEVHANCVRTGCLHVTGETSFDSLKVVDKIKTARIVPLDGDSLIHFGESSVSLNLFANTISWTPIGNIYGAKFGNGVGYAHPLNSLALGFNTAVLGNAENAITIGSGLTGYLMFNDKPNSLAVGFNSNIPTLFVGQSSGANTTGNVGIGTTVPAEKLDVAGSIKSTDLAGTGNRIVTADESGKLTVNAPSVSSNWSLNGNAGTTPSANFIGTTDATDFVIKTNSTERMYFNNTSGFVGIGTSSPSHNLTIHDPGSRFFGGLFGAISSMQFTNSITGSDQGDGLIILTIGNSAIFSLEENSDMLFKIGSPSIEAMHLKPSGFVGIGGNPQDKFHVFGNGIFDGNLAIGTTTPSEKLDVAGSIKSSDLSGTGNRIVTADESGKLTVNVPSVNTNWSLNGNAGTSPSTNFIGTSDAQDLIFRTANAERMRITSAGDHPGLVGIGTATPQKQLHIYTTHNNTASGGGGGSSELSHWGIRLHDLTLSPVGASINTIWDIEPKSKKLIIGKPNDPALTIDDDKNVGIGTTNPQAKLDVAGTIRMKSNANQSVWDMKPIVESGIFKFTVSPPQSVFPKFSVVNDNSSTNNPKYDFHLHSENMVNWGSYVSPFGGVQPPSPGSQVQVGVNILQLTNASTGTTGNDGLLIGTFNQEAFFALKEAGTMKFATNHLTRMTITPDGNVGIGTKEPIAKLDVTVANDADNAFVINKGSTKNFLVKGNGIAYAREVFIYAQGDPIPDYVFEENYSLAGWEQERNHWKKHKHLLGMPSAKDIEKAGAVGMKDFQFNTLKKLEELYLYVDDLKKENEILKKEIEKIKNK